MSDSFVEEGTFDINDPPEDFAEQAELIKGVMSLLSGRDLYVCLSVLTTCLGDVCVNGDEETRDAALTMIERLTKYVEGFSDFTPAAGTRLQ